MFVRRLLCTKPLIQVRNEVPADLPAPMVKPNTRLKKTLVVKSNPVTSRPQIPWQELPHIRTDSLPKKATDIRGIDTSGHQVFSRRQIFGNIPTTLSCKHFTVTYIPHYHVLSSLRKSNVAYTFTNYGAPSLNDQALYKAFSAYRGKYSSMEYFKSIHSPMGTAVSRGNFRKLVKRALFKALHEVVPSNAQDVAKISGIYHFRFHSYPIPEERELLRRDVKSAVVKVFTNAAYSKSLSNITMQQNRAFPNVRMLARDIRVENMLGAKDTPGYFPKLPFLQIQHHTVKSRR